VCSTAASTPVSRATGERAGRSVGLRPVTLLLSRSDLETVLDPDACLDALRRGFAASADAAGLPAAGSPAAAPQPQRVRTDLPGPGTATVLLPGLLPGVPAYTVKANAKFPAARPALRGVVCLHDLGSGELLAVLDSATVTAWRTGLAAALGTHLLARPDATDVGVVGAGAQAGLVVRGLARLRTLGRLVVQDLDDDRARRFLTEFAPLARSGGAVAATPADVAAQCDLVLLATWSRAPLLSRSDVRPGQHLTSLGADEPGKVELAADLLRAARVVVDDVGLASAAGALGNVGLGPEAAAAPMAAVVRGDVAGRGGPDQVTVYAPVGLPWQDLALSWLAYTASVDTGTGATYDWLA